MQKCFVLFPLCCVDEHTVGIKTAQNDFLIVDYSKHYFDLSVNKAPWSPAYACDDENKTEARCLPDLI